MIPVRQNPGTQLKNEKRPAASQRYDRNAAIWPQMWMPIRQTSSNRYDPSSANFMTPIKPVTYESFTSKCPVLKCPLLAAFQLPDDTGRLPQRSTMRTNLPRGFSLSVMVNSLRSITIWLPNNTFCIGGFD
jgi:hypothetical protein